MIIQDIAVSLKKRESNKLALSSRISTDSLYQKVEASKDIGSALVGSEIAVSSKKRRRKKRVLTAYDNKFEHEEKVKAQSVSSYELQEFSVLDGTVNENLQPIKQENNSTLDVSNILNLSFQENLSSSQAFTGLLDAKQSENEESKISVGTKIGEENLMVNDLERDSVYPNIGVGNKLKPEIDREGFELRSDLGNKTVLLETESQRAPSEKLEIKFDRIEKIKRDKGELEKFDSNTYEEISSEFIDAAERFQEETKDKLSDVRNKIKKHKSEIKDETECKLENEFDLENKANCKEQLKTKVELKKEIENTQNESEYSKLSRLDDLKNEPKKLHSILKEKLIKLRGESVLKPENKLDDKLEGKLEDKDELEGELEGGLEGKLEGELEGVLEGELEDELADKLKGKLEKEPKDKFGNELENKLKDLEDEQLENKNGLENELRKELENELKDELWKSLLDSEEGLEDELGSRLERRSGKLEYVSDVEGGADDRLERALEEEVNKLLGSKPRRSKLFSDLERELEAELRDILEDEAVSDSEAKTKGRSNREFAVESIDENDRTKHGVFEKEVEMDEESDIMRMQMRNLPSQRSTRAAEISRIILEELSKESEVEGETVKGAAGRFLDKVEKLQRTHQDESDSKDSSSNTSDILKRLRKFL